MSLADILEEAASALPEDAEQIRPANGDPFLLLEALGGATEAARRVLAWVLEREASSGGELALAWLDAPGGAEVVGGLDESSLGKPGRKALRRALHRLRSQGVALPAREAPAAHVSRLPQIEDEISAAYVSAIDPRGARLVYLVEPNPSGGARLFEILLDESRGIVDFDLYAAGRSRIRRFVRDAVERTRFPAVEAPPEAIRALVARIAARHPVDRALPRQFGEWRSKVAVEGQTPGDLARAALSIADDGDGLARAAELVAKGSIGPWAPPSSDLADLAQEALERQADTAAEEADDAALWRELAEPLFGGERADSCAQRFCESAWVLWKLGQEDDARACLCAAQAFESGAPGDNPVAVAMVEVTLSGALDSLRARAAGPEGA